ncbi:MAG: transposase [Chroococcus sp. CMT-3BRIN-NPC107]|jgi:hypothetical protein|nr:transposase [Chroococcus sp. CMT-3BRIN-NPC107]
MIFAKTIGDWFFGFNLHLLVVNDCGELINITVTAGNVDDHKPVFQLLLGSVVGKVFGYKGYISATLAKSLPNQPGQLITKFKRNMINRLMPLVDMLLLRKRATIESVIDPLKNISQIEHSRHRSLTKFMVNMIAGRFDRLFSSTPTAFSRY